MTKLKERSREICYCGSNIHIEQSWLQCKKKISRNLSHYPKIPCDNLPLPSKVTTMELTIKAYEWKIFEFTRLLIRPKSGWGGWLLNDSCSLVEILKLSRGCVVQWLFYSGKISMQMIPIKITNLFLEGGAFWGQIEQTGLCLLRAINCQVSWWSLDVNENSKYQWLTFWSTLSLVNICRSQKLGGGRLKKVPLF